MQRKVKNGVRDVSEDRAILRVQVISVSVSVSSDCVSASAKRLLETVKVSTGPKVPRNYLGRPGPARNQCK